MAGTTDLILEYTADTGKKWWTGYGDYGNWETTITSLSLENDFDDFISEALMDDEALFLKVSFMDKMQKEAHTKPTNATEQDSVTNGSGNKVVVPSINSIDDIIDIIEDAPLFSEEEFQKLQTWAGGAMEAGMTNQTPQDNGFGNEAGSDSTVDVFSPLPVFCNNNDSIPVEYEAVNLTEQETMMTTTQQQSQVPTSSNTGLAAAAAAKSADHLLSNMDSVDRSINNVRSSTTTAPVPSDGLRKDEITDKDVPCGQGGFSNHHPGARYLRALVAPVRRHYQEDATKDEKTVISQSIVDEIHQSGGRFLKQDKTTGRWFLVSNKKARDKVAQACRETCLLPKPGLPSARSGWRPRNSASSQTTRSHVRTSSNRYLKVKKIHRSTYTD